MNDGLSLDKQNCSLLPLTRKSSHMHCGNVEIIRIKSTNTTCCGQWAVQLSFVKGSVLCVHVSAHFRCYFLFSLEFLSYLGSSLTWIYCLIQISNKITSKILMSRIHLDAHWHNFKSFNPSLQETVTTLCHESRKTGIAAFLQKNC